MCTIFTVHAKDDSCTYIVLRTRNTTFSTPKENNGDIRIIQNLPATPYNNYRHPRMYTG